VNTNHNNGSPFEDAAQQSGQDSTDSLNSNDVGGQDLAGERSPEAEQTPHQEPVSAIPPRRPDMHHSAAGGDYAKHSIEGVSTIQKMVHAMETSGPGYVDEVIGLEPRDRGAIEFRVTCPGSPVRRLRLTGNRYTFGSAEGCSIRLSDDTLRPMHAVLLRDASRIIVRAYSVPVQVNGTRTTEANLSVGDILRLGQYQFELLSVKPMGTELRREGVGAGETRFTESDEEQEARGSESFARSTTAEHEHRSSRFSGTASEGSAAENMLWRDRLRREVDQWRERQIECDRREGRMDERESELRNRETELWSRAETLHRRETRLQSQETANFQLYDEFSQRQQELLAIREENRLREESFHAREVELRDQELQYRSQLEEATRRLHQSQQQAESAAESVAQMREQFESLNTQIEQLSKQHSEIAAREENQRTEHEQLRAGLEAARDRAVQDHAASETRRLAAEEQAAKMEEQIIHLRTTHGSSESEQLTRLSESEAAAENLKKQVEELQQMVSEARNEAEVLRADYEQACSSVQQLENIVSESEVRGDDNREQWIAETSELRSAVEKLSSEMEQANHELNQLREANDDLTRRLTEVKQERDQSRQEVEARPTHQEVESLREQLESTNERLETMQFDHEQTQVQLEAATQKNEYPQEDDSSAYQADAVWEEVGNVGSDVPKADSAQDDSQQDPGSQPVDVNDQEQDVAVGSDEHVTSSSDSSEQDTDTLQTHLEDEMRVDGELPDGDQMVGGSLASKLIQDLEAEDELPSKAVSEPHSSLDDFSNLAYSGEEEEGLRFTGYMRPESETWSTEVEASDDGFGPRSETLDEPDGTASDSNVGLYEVDAEVDGSESDYARTQGIDHDIEDDDASAAEETAAGGLGSDESESDSPLTDGEDEDDTIEAYMNRLLKHVRGDTDPPPDADLGNDASADTGAAQEEDLEPLDPNAPLIPRSLAPERDTDLNAMRELANTSARVAIKRSARLQARNIQLKGVIRLVYALGALSCGGVCYMFLTGFLIYLAPAMTGIVAIIYVREAMQLFQEASYQYSAATTTLQDEGSNSAGNEQYADE